MSLRPYRIDLNGDVGEWSEDSPGDTALMPHLTSANVACCVHAGNALVMRTTIELARRHAVAVGAHPGLADPRGFGRREQTLEPEQAASLDGSSDHSPTSPFKSIR